jgi:DNA helicase-2/ATP-dependent DNA helicase PcrA
MPSPKSNSRSVPFTADDRQRAAIEHVHGPMLVVAGAGTGKTSVLTHRIERLVREGHAYPHEILALTYTKNAANEMRDRVRKLLGGKEVNAATFHDYCLDMLKRVHQDFGVLDDKDLWIYLRRRIRELHLEHYVRAANVAQFLNDLLEFVSRCHDELVTPEKYAQYVERLERREVPIPRVAKSKSVLDDDEILGRCREIARVFTTMERWLAEENLGTFSHMISRAHALLHSDENVLAEARARARFILADEFQDANFAQIQILARLAGPGGNLFAVGDPDQAIYRFRGASSAAFELFDRHFLNPKRVVLDKNRRSTTPILRSAFALIDKNPVVFSRESNARASAYKRIPLQSAREEEAARAGTQLASPKVSVVVLTTKDTEGSDVVAFIRDAQRRSRCKWPDFGILYRSHYQRDDVVQELAEAGIPFVIESMDISYTPEARDLFACLNAVVSSGDDVSLFRVTALPRFQVNPEELRQVMRSIARDNREGQVVPLFAALDRVDGGAEILSAVHRTREEIRRREAKARAALDIIVQQFALDASSPILHAALHFVKEWEKKKVNKTTELEELVDYLALFREAGGVIPLEAQASESAVRLMTVHGAKGLEFPHVFILRANANSFPSSYRETLVAFPRELRDPDSVTEADDQTLHKEEERRLFYVAMTRARDSLQIYSKQGKGKLNKNPDGYMRELIEDKSLAPWLTAIPARGTQTSLDIFAGAEAFLAYPAESQTNVWFELPVLAGLHTRLSASAVDTYERCGLQFKLDRDWRLSAKPAAAMQYGAAIHRILKTYFDSVNLGRTKADDELIDLFRLDLAEAKIREAYQHELYEKQGVAQLREFLAATRTLPSAQVLHTEQSFEIRVGPTSVVGRVDRIDRRPDGSVAIVDYKTGKARDQENADESLQLSLYAIAAKQKWGYTVGALIFYNLEENVAVTTTRNEAQLLGARSRVEAAAQGIADGRFVARTGMHCNFCAYRSLCPEKEKRIPHRVESIAGRSN